MEKHPPLQENLLMILHDLQDNHPQHYLTEEALEMVASYLKLTKSAVFGVARYYTMFSLQPRGKHIIRVCVSAVCELLKSNEAIVHIENHLGIKAGETTADGLFTLEVAECLGQCQDAPSMMIGQAVFNHLGRERIRAILDGIRKQEM